MISFIILIYVRKSSCQIDLMEVSRIEVRDIAHPFPARKADHPPVPFDQTFPLQGLKHAIYMNSGQSGRIGKLLLSDRQLVHRASVQRLRIEAISELAKEMRDAAAGIPLPNVHDPF